MKRKHRRTLAAIYDVQANLDWSPIEGLFAELGADKREQAGLGCGFASRTEQGRCSMYRTPPAKQDVRPYVRS